MTKYRIIEFEDNSYQPEFLHEGEWQAFPREPRTWSFESAKNTINKHIQQVQRETVRKIHEVI